MKLFDFSTSKFDSLDLTNAWEKEIANFLEEWNSNSDFILAQTSGSTGKPKEIKLPKSKMRLSARLTGEFFKLIPAKSALLCLPIGFIAGKMMLVRAIELKLKLYLIEPSSQIEIDDNLVIDFVPMTPMQVEKSRDSWNKIHTLLIGGAPLSSSLRKELLKSNMNSFESYGMTETITHVALKEISEEFFSVLPQIKIRKDSNQCLVIKTPYFEDEIITHDLVELKGGNQFKWLGRLDSVINSAGVKFIPEQLESKLKPHIKEDFIVSSIADETLGEKLILIIENEHPISISFEKTSLTKIEIPKKIFYLKEFPRTQSGKLKRKEILEEILKTQ